MFPNLAGSLAALSSALRQSGQAQEALEAGSEALQICRRMAETDSPAFPPPTLVSSLSVVSDALSNHNRYQETVQPQTELVGLRRQAVAADSALLSYLANSLIGLSNDLWDSGKHQEALEAGTEAVKVYRQIAGRYPMDLAWSLLSLSHILKKLGRRREAVQARTEAAELRRLFRLTMADTPISLAKLFSIDIRPYFSMLIRQLVGLARRVSSRRERPRNSSEAS